MEREEGGREQCACIVHRTGLANLDKVQTRRQTSHVTVTHNREEGRQDGWQRVGQATGETVARGTTGRGARQEGQARRQRWKVEKMVDRGTGGKGAEGMAAGWAVAHPALRECAPRLVACDWPRSAVVAWAAFTGI